MGGCRSAWVISQNSVTSNSSKPILLETSSTGNGFFPSGTMEPSAVAVHRRPQSDWLSADTRQRPLSRSERAWATRAKSSCGSSMGRSRSQTKAPRSGRKHSWSGLDRSEISLQTGFKKVPGVQKTYSEGFADQNPIRNK